MSKIPTLKHIPFKLPILPIKQRSSSRLKFSSIKAFNFNRHTLPSSQTPSLTPKKLNKVSLSQLRHQRIQEKELVSQNLSVIQKRINTIKDLKTKYKIKFTQNEIRQLSDEKLEARAKYKFLQNLKIEAVQKISYWWKRIIIIRKIKKQDRLFEDAAKKIQIGWRQYLFRVSVKNAMIEFKNKANSAALLIQSMFRGYIVRKSAGILVKKRKLERNFTFFWNLRQEVMKKILESVLNNWSNFKVKQNFNKLYSKAIEKERSSILGLLKDRKKTYGVSQQIKIILNKHSEPTRKDSNISEPNSPLRCICTRLRSGTEDFFTLSPNKIDLVY